MQLLKLGHYTVLGVGGGVDMILNTGNTNMHVRGAHELKKYKSLKTPQHGSLHISENLKGVSRTVKGLKASLRADQSFKPLCL